MLRRIECSIALAAVALLAACSSKPETDPAAATSTTSTIEATPPAQDGVKVFIDPATGEIRDPTAEELAEMARSKAAKPEGTAAAQKPAREIHLPNGIVAVEMDPSGDEPLKACRDSQGNMIVSHDCATPAKEQQP
jgi:hypothetical protein